MTAPATLSANPSIPPALLWAVVGALALLLGLTFYYFARPEGTVYALSTWSAANKFSNLPFAEQAPTFLHCYGFILISAAVIGLKQLSAAAIATMWFIFETLFEIAQATYFARVIETILPEQLQQVFLLENMAPYFIKGSFDWLDLLSLALAALCAYVTLKLTSRLQPHYV